MSPPTATRTPRAGVLIASTMGVEQHYYAAFAQWLASQGLWVVTFDYRCMGASRPAQFRNSLRGFEADVLTWAQRDCATMVTFAADRLGTRSLLWIGHFGFFRRKHAETLWPHAGEWLHRQAAQA